MDTVSSSTFTERMLSRASSSRLSYRQSNLFQSLDNQMNRDNNKDRLADVSVVSSLTAAINDIENDIDALGIPYDYDEKLHNNKTPTRKQMKKRKQTIVSSGTPDSFNEKRIRRTSSRASNSKKNLFNSRSSQIEIDDNDDDNYPCNDSLLSSLTAAINDLDNECDELGILSDKPPEMTFNCFVDDKTKILESKNITETPRALRHITRPNLESTRKSLNLLTQENITKTYSSHNEILSPILPKLQSPEDKENIYKYSKQDKNDILSIPGYSGGLKNNDNKSQLSHDVASALCSLENVIDDNMNSTFVPSQTHESSNTKFSSSDLISSHKKPFFQRMANRLSRKYRRAPTSMNNENPTVSDNHSTTFLRTTKLYRSVSQRIKEGFRNSWTRREPSDNNMSPEFIEQAHFSKIKIQEIEKLILKIKVEKEAINQARKALVHCHSNVEFFGSEEEIEFERVLLLASIKKRLLTEELKQLYEKSNEMLENPTDIIQQKSHANVEIDKICLTLKKTLDKNLNPGDVADWFVMVITEGYNIWASSPVTCEVGNPFIEFTKFSVSMSRLSPSLKIILEVYNLKLKIGRVYDDVTKYHVNHPNLNKSTACPSPTKLLKKVERPIAPRTLRITSTGITSSFKLSGRTVLDVKDLNLSAPWPLMGVPQDSILLGTINFDLKPMINIAVRHKGFLTQCGENNGIPTRDVRWCVLNGRTLSLWKYQDDEGIKAPLIEVDLVDCYTKTIQVTTETLCAKPKTILIETMRKKMSDDYDSMVMECRHHFTIVRYFLSCDTKKDLKEWLSKLNRAISLVREWDDSIPHSLPKSPLVSDL